MNGHTDDPTIPDDTHLWRRVPPWHFVYDKNLGIMRPSSAAFANHSDGSPMSVLLADVVRQAGRGDADVLVGHAGYALSVITVGLARACNQGVARDPLPDEPAHAVVFGKKTKSVRKELAKGSEWVIPPPDPVGQQR